MNIFIVYAHHEPSSLTAAMKNVALDVLGRQGHNIVVSDLYAQGFSPVAQKWDFVTTSGKHFNYMLEQKHAANLSMSFSPDITSEMQKVTNADVIMFIAPLWWSSVPAILKGWFDRILAMGFAWDSSKFYETGLLRGKQAIMITAAGHPGSYYSPSGQHKATIDQVLYPINWGTLAFCGLNVHDPFVVQNALGLGDNDREEVLKELSYRLEHFVDSPHWLHLFN